MNNKDVFQNIVMFENCSIIRAKEEGGNYVIHAVAQQYIKGSDPSAPSERIFTPVYIIVDKTRLSYLPQTKELYTVAGPFHSNPDMGVFFVNPSISKNQPDSYGGSNISTGVCIISQDSVDEFSFSEKAYYNTLGVLVYHKNLILNVGKIDFSQNTKNLVSGGNIKQDAMPPLNSNPMDNKTNDAANNSQAKTSQYSGVKNQSIQHHSSKNGLVKPISSNVGINDYNNTNVSTDVNSTEVVDKTNTLGVNSNGQKVSYNEIVLDESTVRNLINIL